MPNYGPPGRSWALEKFNVAVGYVNIYDDAARPILLCIARGQAPTLKFGRDMRFTPGPNSLDR